jgi:hypothetical protein
MRRIGSILIVLTFALAGANFASADGHDVMPSGEHFTLNILGKEKIGGGKSDKFGGNAIFVPLSGLCRIDLTSGSEFLVTDPNCVKDGRASFQLDEVIGTNDDGTSFAQYAVYIRALAKPGGEATFRSCFTDDGEEWCSTETVTVTRIAGQSQPTDITKESLSVCQDADGDGEYTREPLFSEDREGYYWEYTNDGLRLAQLRFYPAQVALSDPCV